MTRLTEGSVSLARVTRLLRLTSVVGLSAVVVDAILLATGIIDWPVALVLLLAVEAPLGLTAGVLHLRVYCSARRAGADPGAAWEVLLRANPPLRLIQVEVEHVMGLPRDLRTLVRGAHRGPGRFGYSRGTLAVPVTLTALLVLETVAVHLVVPWAWLRLVLLLLNLYAVLLVCSVLVGRVARPHTLSGAVLQLRCGRHVVADVPVAGLSATPLVRREHTWLAVNDPHGPSPVAHVANQFGTNVRLTPARPVSVRVPRTLGPDLRHQVGELHLMVDDPQELLADLLEARQDA